jgi:hypothetical protein
VEGVMNKLLLTLISALLTTGCSPLMYPGHYRNMTSPYAASAAAESAAFGRWDNVMRLTRDSTIDVLTLDGAANIGPIIGADVQSVRLLIDGVETRISRSDVVRIDLVNPGAGKPVAVARKAAGGALIGVAGMTLLAGVIGGEAWPPPGIFLRAGAAGGALSGAQSELLRRQSTIIYLAPIVPRP